MVSKKNWLGILVMLLVLGMTVVGCNDDSDDESNGEGGILTINGIPSEYNGKYMELEGEIMVSASERMYIEGFVYNASTNTYTCAQISNGVVKIPIWIWYHNEPNRPYERYYGNHTGGVEIFLYDSDDPVTWTDDWENRGRVWQPVKFTNGSATVNWGAGEDYYWYD